MDIQTLRIPLLISVFFLLYMVERVWPFFQRKLNLRHTVVNISFSVLNWAVGFAAIILIFPYLDQTRFGLFHLFELNPILETILILLAFDLWMYTWHVMNHEIPFLWKFHKVHHSDNAVEASSAFRFHPGEIILSTLARAIIIPILGVSMYQVAMYEIILIPLIMFHHSNVNLNEKVDKLYRILFASPRLHRLHHSDISSEANSNYGSVLIIWDRIFKTFQLRKDQGNIVQGVKSLAKKRHNEFWGMLKTPLE